WTLTACRPHAREFQKLLRTWSCCSATARRRGRSRTAPRNKRSPSFARKRARLHKPTVPWLSPVARRVGVIAGEVHLRAEHLQVSDHRIHFGDARGVAVKIACLSFWIALLQRVDAVAVGIGLCFEILHRV